jgi:hypothetical protein
LSSFSILGFTGEGGFPADDSDEAPASPLSPSSRVKLSPTVDVSDTTGPALSPGPEPSVLARAELSCRLLVLPQQPALLPESVADGNCRRADEPGRNAQQAPQSRCIIVEVSVRRRQGRGWGTKGPPVSSAPPSASHGTQRGNFRVLPPFSVKLFFIFGEIVFENAYLKSISKYKNCS